MNEINKYLLKWDWFTVHLWLFTSSYGIIFAFLSFLQDTGCLNNTIDKLGNCTNDIIYRNCWGKGFFSIIFGSLFYILVGLRHIRGTNRMINN